MDKAVVAAPNGERITMKDVYNAIYKKEKVDALRYGQLLDGINAVQERMNNHDAFHNLQSREEIVSQEIKLDAKKAGILTALGAAVGAFLAMMRNFVFA